MSLRRRMVCGLLALMVSLPLSMPVSSYASANFFDTYGHWADSFIKRAYNLEIVNGYPGGYFYPDKPVTRGEFVSMINNAFDIDNSETAIFTDVYGTQWYSHDISVAVAASYAGGYSDNTFRPDNPVSRQEAAVMLSRILPNYKGGSSIKSFRDNKQIASWAVSAIEKLASRQYMGAYSDGKIHPNDPLTRAQTAKIICDILDNETFVHNKTYIDEDKAKLSEKIYTDEVLIDEDLGEGSVTIDNCVILGTLTVEGGGGKSVTINNSRIANMKVNKEDTPVHIVTKGTTTIPKVTLSQKSSIQSSGKNGTGILDVIVNRGADVSLKGDFPSVTIKGSAAAVALESGKIKNLIVNKGGKYSDITLSGKAEVSEATVNAESYFHGTGTITHMNVNADDITYETKPLKMTVGVDTDRAIGEGDDDTDIKIEFDPDHKDSNVNPGSNITITFNTPVKLAGGGAITNSNINNFVSLLEGSKTSGTAIQYTGTINSAKKEITIDPTDNLAIETRYYVIIKEDALINASGNKNDEEYIYFTTNDDTSDSSTSFSPKNGANGVSLNPSITIRFDENVVQSGDGKAVDTSYLQNSILFKQGGPDGANVAFTATFSYSDRITITPGTALTAGQKYYVAVVANKFKYKKNGKAIPASSATWTVQSTSSTSSTPVINSFTVTPGEKSIKIDFTPSASGTFYALAAEGSSVPTDDQILAGSKVAVTANSASTLTLQSLKENTSYTVYAILRSSDNVNSGRSTATAKTAAAAAPAISGFTLTPGEKTIRVDFTPNAAGSVYIKAVQGAASLTADQILTGTKVPVSENTASSATLSGLNPNTIYTVYAMLRTSGNVDSEKVKDTVKTELSTARLNALTVVPHGGSNVLNFDPDTTSYTVTVPSGTSSVDIAAQADSGTRIYINNTSYTPGNSRSIDLSSGTATITVTSTHSGKTDCTYTVTVNVL